MSNLQTYTRTCIMKLFAALSLGLFMIGGAYAAPVNISGEVTFGGTLTVDTANLEDANVLTFGATLVTSAIGDPFSDGVGFGDSATFATLDLDGSTLPIDPFWSIVGQAGMDWFFSLENITLIDRDTAGSIGVFGTGTLYTDNAGVYNPTFGLWSLSADKTGATIAFSSTTSVVPEPASIALLGLGLLGFAGLRRKATSS